MNRRGFFAALIGAPLASKLPVVQAARISFPFRQVSMPVGIRELNEFAAKSILPKQTEMLFGCNPFFDRSFRFSGGTKIQSPIIYR